MSWSRHFSGLGRFSPFARSAPQTDGQISDEQYSYITSDDLNQHLAPPKTSRSRSRSHSQDDILVLKHRRVSYPVHFERGAIDDGELTIGMLRIEAAKQMGLTDPRRIKLFYKGTHLRDDKQLARDEGLMTQCEILCVVGEAAANGVHNFDEDVAHGAHGGSDDEYGSEDSDAGGVSPGLGGPTSGGKKKRNRRGKKKSGRKQSSTPQETPGYVGNPADLGRAEYLPLPTGAVPRPSSASSKPSPAPSAAPQTALGKLNVIASNYHTNFAPNCTQFISSPPTDKAKRDFDYKRLSETILAQILLKLDAVETEGDPDARLKRKEIVKEVQNMLNRLDEAAK